MTVTGIMAKLDVPGRSIVNTGFFPFSFPIDFTVGIFSISGISICRYFLTC